MKRIIRNEVDEHGQWEIIVFTQNRKFDKFVQYIRINEKYNSVSYDTFDLSSMRSYTRKSKRYKPECKVDSCIDHIKMLNWNDEKLVLSLSGKKLFKYGKDPRNLNGIIKCNNPECHLYFNYVIWQDSLEYKANLKELIN